MTDTIEILAVGLASGYEIEHLARVFFPKAVPRKGRQTGGALVYARAGKNRLVAGLRLPEGGCHLLWEAPPKKQEDRVFCLSRLLYRLLKEQTGLCPPWGMLTGVRPVNYLRRQLAMDGEAGARAFMVDGCDLSPSKYHLARRIVTAQQPLLAALPPKSCSLYISIPFCPSRCSYCSFVSRSIKKDAVLIAPYLDRLLEELAATAELIRRCGLHIASLYIGGGTPTALSLPQLDRLLGGVAQLFDTAAIPEYTVEAGRPDCTPYEKLALLKSYGVTRISINPQTLSDRVLENIGRHHTAADIFSCYEAGRRAGHQNINMDLIAGLPGDDAAGFAATLEGVLGLAPENITLHTLTYKRASDIRRPQAEETPSPAAMLDEAYGRFDRAGYQPYYLYRQKSGLENLENTGWAKPGFEGLYNIYIMEEVHSILAAGAGGSTKLVSEDKKQIKRLFNYKYPVDYIQQFEQVLNKKGEVLLFYAGNMDT